jgi:hypothetical protein
MMKRILQILCLGAAIQGARAAQTNVVATGVRMEPAAGWDNALILSGGDAQAVVLPAVGGHMVQYAVNGEDIFYLEPGSGGRTLANSPDGFTLGGHQCGVGSGSRGLPESKGLWLGPWRWKAPRPHMVTLESEPDPGLGLQVSKEILVDPESGEVGLQQRVTNVSKEEGAYWLWGRTACKGGGYALVPLNKKSRFRSGWSLARRDADGKTYYDGVQPADQRARVLDRVLVVEARGALLKLGADTDQEWVAYTVGKLLLVKYFPYVPNGRYGEGGNSVLFSIDEKRAELQVLSPEGRLRPGESQVLPEKWALLELESSAGSFAEARALIKRIPPSPFKK